MSTMDRRSFTKLSLLATAAAALPLRAESQQPVRFAPYDNAEKTIIFLKASPHTQK